MFLGTGSLFYERKLSDLTSAQLGVGYLGFKSGDTKFSGLILTPEFRIYPKKNALNGVYIAPYLRYQNFKLTSGVNEGTLSVMGAVCFLDVSGLSLQDLPWICSSVVITEDQMLK